MKLEIPKFDAARVLVVGDVMLDRYWHGATSRISPEAPVPVVKVGNAEDSPGGAGNVALNLAALGAAATLVGLVGLDEAGEELETRLRAAGVLCDFEKVADKPTITKLRIVSRHQQLIRLDFEEAFDIEQRAGSKCQGGSPARRHRCGYCFRLQQGRPGRGQRAHYPGKETGSSGPG